MTRSILIVGAERGLGLGLARQFLGRGWDVTGTCRDGDDVSELEAAGRDGSGHLHIAHIDVTRADLIDPLRAELGDRTFDVIYFVAGIYGPVHNSVLEATDADFAEVMLTNCFGPIRLARRLVDRLRQPGGTLAFMSSHRASIERSLEPALPLELYRASKVALNMLARGIYADHAEEGLTVLSIHPGWVATSMGTLDGTVEAEISVDESIRGVAKVLEDHAGNGENRYLDWEGSTLPR